MDAVENQIAVFCKSVTKSYVTGPTKVMALRGVDLEVRQGELLMLVGPSGCGKTTLISVVAGILDHDEGECLVFQRDLRGMGQTKKTRYRGQNVGFVFQAYNLLPTLTALENVSVPLLILGVARKEAHERAKGILEQVGLADRMFASPAQLSGGQQQRVAIARALANEPKVLMADEPTANLDSKTTKDIRTLLVELNRELRQTCVVVTHDLSLMEDAHRVISLVDGRIAADEPGGAAS